jgi:hypothetical protein
MGNAIPSSQQSPYQIIATLVLDAFFILLACALVGRFLGFSDPSAPTVIKGKTDDDDSGGDDVLDSIEKDVPTSDNIELIPNDSEKLKSDNNKKRSMSIDLVVENTDPIATQTSSPSEDQSVGDQSNEPISNMTIRKLSSSKEPAVDGDDGGVDNSPSKDSRTRKPPPKKKAPPPSRSNRYLEDGELMHTVGLSSKLELSQEEREMNGAPEGDLYVSVALPRAELPKYDESTADSKVPLSFARALMILSDNDFTNVAWNTMFDAITTVRVILVHYRYREDMHLGEALPEAVPAIVAAARNTRSVLAKV